ncbi:MAG: NAD(P)H-dependent oxidoreductase [Puniceicoccales bacterium]|jgi:FMN-dependent NADH-azoreductase|nr:NAD(P)H-dependent oxidoreductase [Puniceicoccales bacterium]
MKTLLFINGCVRRKISRTNRIAKELAALLRKAGGFTVDELVLENENMPIMTSAALKRKLQLTEKGDFDDRVFRWAKQFKDADAILMAAPYWNSCFPATVKTYIELVGTPGLTYKYGEDGKPIGLCRAKSLYYVTTRGGYYGDQNDPGFAIITNLGRLYGIKEIRCISAEGLDIVGSDANAIIDKVIQKLPNQLE